MSIGKLRRRSAVSSACTGQKGNIDLTLRLLFIIVYVSISDNTFKNIKHKITLHDIIIYYNDCMYT